MTFDLAVIGAPIDTLVSFRPGARFGEILWLFHHFRTQRLIAFLRTGPYGIRSGSRRQRPQRGYHPSPEIAINPYQAGFRVVDCGDVPMYVRIASEFKKFDSLAACALGPPMTQRWQLSSFEWRTLRFWHDHFTRLVMGGKLTVCHWMACVILV